MMYLSYRYGYVSTIKNPRRAGGMARIVSLKKLFEEIREELERRLIHVNKSLKITFRLKTDIGSITLKVSHNDIRIVEGNEAYYTAYTARIPQNALVQLVLGYRNVYDLSYGSLEAEPKVLKVLQILFPQEVPYVWHPDRW